MKNWETVDADEVRILSKHFSQGRGGHKVEFIGIHHNAGNLSIQQTYNVWQNRPASAHYQVDINGRIGQLVWDRDTAWALGNFNMNQRSINIEHANNTGSAGGWTISEATLENGAHLVAALCKAFNLGRPVWGQNVRPHSQISPTACPGAIGGTQRDAYMARAQYWYDQMTGSKPAPAPQPAPQPTPQPAPAVGYTVKVTTNVLNIRKGAGTNFATAGSVKKGEVYTIVAESAGQGASKWGKLKSGAGWISLDFVQKTSGGSAPAAPKPAKKDNTTIAREVLAGKWGNGTDRKSRLQAAGYNYDAIQAEVNHLSGRGSAPARKSIDTIAREVIRGNWGSGAERKRRLQAAGYDYNAVQRRVNQLL